MVSKCNRNTPQALLMFFAFSMILFFPSLTMILLGQSSFTLGIVAASLCISFFLGIHFYLHRTVKLDQSVIFALLIIVSCCLFIFVHLFFVNQQLPMLVEVDAKRFIFSFACIFIVVLSAFLAALYLKNNSTTYHFYNVVNICGILLLLNGLISLTKIDFFSTGLAKPTFLFLEPSHFALVVTPFLIYFCLTLSRNKALLLLLIVASWAGYIQNLTLLMGVVLAFTISTRQNLVFAALLFTLFVGALITLLGIDSLSYFTDRLVLSGDNDNLSVLVLFQGWQNAIETLTTQSYLGGGFQQFGVTTVYGSVSDKLYALLGFSINQFDGGATAPKLVGEFGIFGIAFLCGYLIFYLKVFLTLRSNASVSKMDVFFYAIFLASFLEFFIRGVGYFSPLMYLFLVSVFYFTVQKAKIKLEKNETDC
ncbi:hypothetical protein [Shewanella sp. SR43-8]|uniref:hypothetical protein n=1 Tax=Shewanella sp. SR43-8 TaxID=2760938 RepID=UPI001601D78F|nr:hypothetical protein [Shewanella sp. SR43-8]MBB1323748.1 hypothetical protein [Shewanella sp. SR43-8]